MDESTLRPFNDLINEIEVDGERFIPAQKIAALCYNYNEEAVKSNVEMWVNDSYDCAMWYVFESPFKKRWSIGIYRNYDIRIYYKIPGVESSNAGMPACNQVEIITNLMRWGFITCP